MEENKTKKNVKKEKIAKQNTGKTNKSQVKNEEDKIKPHDQESKSKVNEKEKKSKNIYISTKEEKIRSKSPREIKESLSADPDHTSKSKNQKEIQAMKKHEIDQKTKISNDHISKKATSEKEAKPKKGTKETKNKGDSVNETNITNPNPGLPPKPAKGESKSPQEQSIQSNKKASPKKGKTFGILDIAPSKIVVPPEFTEPETIEAMKELGYAPKDLILITKDDYEKLPPNQAVREQIIQELDKRRRDAIDKIIDQRNALINKAKNNDSTSRDSPRRKLNVVKKAKNKLPGQSTIDGSQFDRPMVLKKRKSQKGTKSRKKAPLRKKSPTNEDELTKTQIQAKATEERLALLEKQRLEKSIQQQKERAQAEKTIQKNRTKIEKEKQKNVLLALKKTNDAEKRQKALLAKKGHDFQAKLEEREKRIKEAQAKRRSEEALKLQKLEKELGLNQPYVSPKKQTKSKPKRKRIIMKKKKSDTNESNTKEIN